MKIKMTLSLKQVTFAIVSIQNTALSDIRVVCTYLLVVMHMTAYRRSMYKCNVDSYLLHRANPYCKPRKHIFFHEKHQQILSAANYTI